MAYTSIINLNYNGAEVLVARTGYTGEKGYEVYLTNHLASSFWQKCIETKNNTNIIACGLGARDTLRLEACYLLYGNDINKQTNPLEAGISWAIHFNKDKGFIGREKLLEVKEKGIQKKLYAFQLEETGIARQNMDVYYNNELVGYVTMWILIANFKKIWWTCLY